MVAPCPAEGPMSSPGTIEILLQKLFDADPAMQTGQVGEETNPEEIVSNAVQFI